MFDSILFFESTLYVRFSLFVSLGFSRDALSKDIQRCPSFWDFIADPDDGRKRLIAYEPLKPKYKDLIKSRFGDPYKWIEIQFFADRMVYKSEDQQIINEYRTDTGEALPRAKRIEYKEACGVLAYLETVGKFTKMVVKLQGFQTVSAFWSALFQFIKGRSIKLPTSKRLQRKLKDYIAHGAYSVISGKFGNNNRKKVTNEARTVIVKLMRDNFGRKFAKKEVWRQFKALSKANNWGLDSITYACLCGHIEQTRHLWYAERHGDKEFMLNQTLIINQRKVSQPHLQWQLDGTPAPLWYYCPNRKTINKLYAAVVIDSHSDAVVGYSIGETENQNLVFSALKMAVRLHGVKPHELRADNGSAIKGAETQSLLSNLKIRFKPSKVGNARSRSVESSQGHWMRTVLTYFENRSGLNITAKTLDSRQNSDKVKQHYKQFPSKSEVIDQLHISFQLYNNWERDQGTRKERLQDAAPDLRRVDTLEVLENFYVFRKKGKKYTSYPLTMEGITMQVDKKVYRYLPQVANAQDMASFINRHNNRTKFYIKYDPSDLSQIGLYVLPDSAPEANEEYFRFLTWATTKKLSAQYLPEATDEELETYRYMRQVQREQVQQVKDELSAHEELLQNMNVLQGGIDIQTVRKDDWNNARLEVERMRDLGFIESKTVPQQQEEYLPNLLTEDDDEGDVYDNFDINDLKNLIE